MANKYLKVIFLTVLVFSINTAYAGGPPPPPPPDLPIDGGIMGLFIVAIGYAIKKIVDNSKK